MNVNDLNLYMSDDKFNVTTNSKSFVDEFTNINRLNIYIKN